MNNQDYIELPEDFPADRLQQLAKAMETFARYKTRLDGRKIYLERISEPGDLFVIRGTVTKDSSVGELRALVKDIYPASFPQAPMPQAQVTAAWEKMRVMKDASKSRVSLRNYEIECKNAMMADKKSIDDKFPQICENFFSHFPNGRIMFITKEYELSYHIRMPALMASTYYLSFADIQELIPGAGTPIIGIQTFGRTHNWLIRDFHASLLNMFGQSLNGFTVQWVSHTFIFLFGQTIQTDLGPLNNELHSIQHSMWAWKLEERKNNQKIIEVDALEEMITRYTENLNAFLKYVLNLNNFKQKNGLIRSDIHYQMILTIDAAMEIYSRILICDDPLTKKLLFFDFMDRYLEMTGKAQIKDALNRKQFSLILENVFDKGTNGLQASDPMKQFYQSEYDKVIEDFMGTIYQPSRIKDNTVLVGREKEMPVAKDTYWLDALDALRDTTHGYRLVKERFSKFLAISSGEVSDHLPELVVPLFLNIIVAYPEIFARLKFIAVPESSST